MNQIIEPGVSPTKEGKSERRTKSTTASRTALQDCLFLSLIVLLSVVLYIKDLGLYSDDWHFLGLLTNSADQSLFGLFDTVIPYTRLRPIESLYVAGLYWLFGLQPLQYHIVNAAVFTGTILLLYLSLRELVQVRVFTLAIPLVYALLPHYSSDRFWFIAFVINLSIGSYFLSVYSDLRSVRAGQKNFWKWKLLGTTAMLFSAFAYEVALPLFLLNPLLVWLRARQLHDPVDNHMRLPRKATVVSLASTVLSITVVVAYKILIARGEADLFVHRMGIRDDYSHHLFRLVVGAIGINYGSYGIALPLKIGRILRSYPNPEVLALGLVIGILVFVYLYREGGLQSIETSSERTYFRLMAVGIIVFALGYAIFLTNSQVGFSSTGVYNRTSIAAALGVAISFVGLIGWVSWVLPSPRLRRLGLSLLVSVLCASGFLINNTIATFWGDASRRQQAVIAAVSQAFPVLAPDITLILDGVCPYSGPGIVFECYWDVGGMLKTYYHNSSLSGDIVKQNTRVEEEGLYTSIYGEKRFYPYNNKLILFHLGENKIYPLVDADNARRYFQVISPDYKSRCPDGDEGYGTPIF